MADTMQFDLVSPERRLASLQVISVLIPGADGDMTVYRDHAPVITTLRPGVMTVTSASGTTDYAVSGGFAEISAEGTSVLAEKAMPISEFKAADIDALVAEATEAGADLTGPAKDVSAKLLADLEALRAAAGL